MDEESAADQVASASNSNHVAETIDTSGGGGNGGDGGASSSPHAEVNVEELEGGERGAEDEEAVVPLRMRWRRFLSAYRLDLPLIGDATSQSDVRLDLWSCLVSLLAFWFLASMMLILGFYGANTITLGPNGSRIIQVSSFFVQSIKVHELESSASGPMLYSFDKPPPVDVEKNWSENHNVSVEANDHKEWLYFLNKGSRVEIYYNVKNPPSFSFVTCVQSLVEWIEDPSYPNSTLSWNIIHESGKITHEIPLSSNYYIAVGNLNSDTVEVNLKFEFKALVFNTSKAYNTCHLSIHACSITLSLFGANAAVLTSPGPEEAYISVFNLADFTVAMCHCRGVPDGDWYFKQTYGPRWLVYLAGSGVLTAPLLVTFRICNMFEENHNAVGGQATAEGSEHTPLLHKDDDLSSWASSYDSVSQEEDDPEEDWLVAAGNTLEENHGKGGGSHHPRRLCVICCDAPIDCFFLPCGHCAACFACGSRIEEAGHCPICRRKSKKSG
uniref:RING-type domain-containing protein n=1 Tax=Kalanchoe fedtschenkoi TaxID=63787 RepID=A0A7N0TH98_KALFE